MLPACIIGIGDQVGTIGQEKDIGIVVLSARNRRVLQSHFLNDVEAPCDVELWISLIQRLGQVDPWWYR